MKASVSLKLTILVLQTDQFKIHTFLKYKTKVQNCFLYSVIVKFILTRLLFLHTIKQYYDANLRLA